MKLLIKNLKDSEIQQLIDLVEGNVARLVLSNEPTEIISSLGFAIDRLSTIAYSRIKEIEENRKNEI